MAITMDVGGDNKAANEQQKNDGLDDIRATIKLGLEKSQENAENISKILDGIEVFNPVGVDQNIIQLLESVKFLFDTTVPAILKGDYETLTKNNNTSVSDDSMTSIYKDMRKQLVKNLSKENK
jgi:hypothetical protein